jgi:hypothetical protein
MGGCAEADPQGGGGSGGGGFGGSAGSGGSGGSGGTGPDGCNDDELGARSCTLPADWYTPGVTDSWAECATSDDGTYDKIDPNVSSIARVAAFESIADRLWRGGKTPSASDFTQAALDYAVEEGLGSRVARREDEHYPKPTSGSCTEAGVPAQFPDRCVGPAKLAPLVEDAFQKGASGESPKIQAARLEAALVFFFYVSSHKEATTCFNTAKDCDSAWAYYNGGTSSEEPLGFARYVMDLDPSTHTATENGVLAVRCWRELDQAAPATDKEMQGRAVSQLDAGLTRGLLLVARDRFQSFSCATGVDRDAAFTFLQTLLPFLDRPARAIDASAADTLKAQIVASADDVDAEAAVDALDLLHASCD